MKIDEFLEPLAKKVSKIISNQLDSENKKSEKPDHDMKSNNSSNDRIKNHIQFFNFSRKNSPEEEIILSNKNSNDFKNAYDNVFVFKKESNRESNSGSELNRNISMEDDTEMGLKEYHTERINHVYPNGFNNNQKNEMNMKQGSYNKFYYLDLNNVDQIVNNSKEDIESKNIKLAKFLIEINNLSKIANQDEIKTLMQIQAKILESMISLTKHSQIQNREV